MNGVLKKILSVVLALLIVWLVYLIVQSVMEPVNFNKEKAHRETVGIQRMKDLRDLEVAYKSVNNRFTASLDTLRDFYNNGKMKIVMQVGSSDDSLAVAHTDAVKKAHKGKVTPEILFDLYNKGDRNLVFSINQNVAVKDTLFHGRDDFDIDSLGIIPFSGGKPVLMDAVVKKVSGVDVPLFEAKMPYDDLLKGLERQLVVNLNYDRQNQNKYEGLQVGSVTAPNNNAGNWE